MNLRALQYLVAVAEHGSFSKAAQACEVSQPTLSTQLRKLEEELGLELFDNNSRNATLTAAGHQATNHARDALKNIDRMRDLARIQAGLIRIGIFPTLGQYLLPHITKNLHETLPDRNIHWVERKSIRLSHMLVDRQLDATILALPLPAMLDGYTVTPLFNEDFVLAYPATHTKAQEPGLVNLNCVNPDELILLDDGHCLRDHVIEACGNHNDPHQPRARAHSLETLRHMVASGMGLTLLPRLAVIPPAPNTTDIALKDFMVPRPHRSIVMVTPKSTDPAQHLATVADSISSSAAQALANHPNL